MTRHLTLATNSSMSTYRRCPREYKFSYVDGYRSTADAEALRIGTLIHLALERWWLGESLESVLDVCAQAADEYEAAKLRVMLRGYDARWSDERAAYAVRKVEAEFRAPLRNPDSGAASRTFALGGKIDVLLERGIVEHKTTSTEIGLGSVYWQKLALNSQVATYYAGARALGVEPEVCVYDVLRKPAQRPSQVALKDDDGVKIVLDANGERVRTKDGKKWRQTADSELGLVLQTRPETAEEYEARLTEEIAASPEKYYQRGEIVRLEQEERDYAQDVWALTQAMREAERTNAWVRNTDSCQRFGNSMCPFWAVCSGTASLDDASHYTRVEHVHQELTADAAQ